MYDVTVSYNGTGEPNSLANTGFQQITPNVTNCALYRYDVFTGGAGDENSPIPKTMWHKYGGSGCTPRCSAPGWAAGTKITLSEPVYKINGRANVMFNAQVAKRASKFSCNSCKCQEGCQVTVTVTNDGKKFSGSGLGGKVWAGTGAMFSLKDIVPTVQYIDHGLPGYRDSTRIMGPASGGTTITVVGENFQDSPLLRCYFAGVQTLVKAEWISSTKVRCKTPDFFSRQLDGSMTASFQDGSAKNPHTKVHVTNDGMISIPETENDPTGHISQNPHLNDDGSKSYIWTFDVQNTYDSGMTGFYSNPFRSTCQAGLYPNEGMTPCWDSHTNEMNDPHACIGEKLDLNKCQSSATYSAGNDVLFKYATCYDANPAKPAVALNLYTGTTSGSKYINQTTSLGQKISMPEIFNTGANVDNVNDGLDFGPLTYMEFHFEKASEPEARLEVTIVSSCTSSGNLCQTPAGFSGNMETIATETIVISKIASAVDYAYPVFFTKPPYMMPGRDYYVQVKWISGATDVEWKYTDGSASAVAGVNIAGYTDGAYYSHINHLIGYQFKLKGYTCDGCRTKYVFDPATPDANTKFGSWHSTQDTGSTTVDSNYISNVGSVNLNAGNPYRSMQSQEFRPTETGTLTHVQAKLAVVANNGVDQAYVSVWITQHGKYGEYVCSTFGGLLEAGYYGNTLGQASSSAGGASQANNQAAMGASLNVCDSDFDGEFDNACGLGTVCDPNLALNGGCGYYGQCTLAETVTNGHRLRPQNVDSTAASARSQNGPCGPSENCADSMTLAPDHQKLVKGTTAKWVEFELKTPVPIEKHTTYFINMAVVGSPDISKEVIWQSGVAYGDGGAKARMGTTHGSADANPVSDELRASFTRTMLDWRWEKNTERVLATKLTRCVSSTAQVLDFVTQGEKTGCCSARASPQGGLKGSMVTITGRNFFPSDDLRCIFRNADGTTGAIVPGEPLDASYTSMRCAAPTLDPHAAVDCTNPALCQGTTLVVTNDLYTVGPQFMGPKWYTGEPTTNSQGITHHVSTPAVTQIAGVPAYLGLNPLKFLFSDIFVSPTGSDTVGDGTIARPYQTIQRALDAANEYDQIQLLSGYYVGLGNRGLRHHGKKIQMKAYQGDLQNTIIDCQHAPDGFILNNNKDSDSPFAGYIDTQDLITKNCENLRIYDI